MGQAIVVISGGIDLSIGAVMALTSVVSASLMKGQSEEFAVAIVLGVLLLGLVLGAINGGVVVITRVPDIVVTLAMSFVWAGFALLVLKTPGGASAKWLKDLVTGSLVNEWIPKGAVVLILVVALIWIPIRRTRVGLSIYAIGSNRLAAFRSGVPVDRTRVFAYMLTGLFAALGGLALTASTGHRDPGARALHPAERCGRGPRGREPRWRPRRRVRADRRGRDPPADPHRHDVPQRQHQPRLSSCRA